MNDRSTRSDRASWAARIWLVAVVSGMAAAWAGCSVEKNYKLLSFFFDGVPDPNAPMATVGPLANLGLRQSPTYTIHKPFAEDACVECHGARFRMEPPGLDVCMKCHADVTTRHERMHGPVVAQACLWCHNPHESAYAALLKNEPRQVCTQCHEPALLNVNRVPAHADARRSCLDCHTGHGGASKFFLREPAAGRTSDTVRPPGS